MKRSEINKAIISAKNRFAEFNITLPMFGYWTLDEWRANKDKIARIKERMLGWMLPILVQMILNIAVQFSSL